MVQIPVVNWIIIGLEILIGFVWSGVFFVEFFPFLQLSRVKYRFSEKYNFVIKKSTKTFLIEFFRFLGNAILVLLIVILSYILTDQEIPIVSAYLSTSISLPILYVIITGVVVLLIPKPLMTAIFSPYWTRQLKYFFLLGTIFLPLFLLDQQTVQNIAELQFLFPAATVIVNLFLPMQLLAENGVARDLIQRQQLFLLIFIILPFSLSLLYQILPKVIGMFRRYGIYEWQNNSWQPINDKAYVNDDDTAVLLLHGLTATKEKWSSFTKERGTERIMDHLDLNADERYMYTKIFAIDFSNKLKNTFSSKYQLKHAEELFGASTTAKLNNYVWELLFAILLLKDVKQIERIHLISHSSGGVIIRKMLEEIYTNPALKELRKGIDFDTTSNTITIIDKITWLAAPHFGAKGGSATILASTDIFIFRNVIRFLFLIPGVETTLDRLGRMLITFGLDARGAHDLDPHSGFIKSISDDSNRVVLYGSHEYKNAYATEDEVVGSGAIIKKQFNQLSPFGTFAEKGFTADHDNTPWEQLNQLAKNQIYDVPPIHHSLEVLNWIFS